MARTEGVDGLLVDVDTGVLRPDRVLVQSGPGAMVFLGFGARAGRLCRYAFGESEGEDADPDPFIARCRHIDEALERGDIAKALDHDIPRAVLGITDRPLRRLAIAEILAKAGYNPDEPRVPAGSPGGGEWTTGGGADGEAGSDATGEPELGAGGPEIQPAAAQSGSVQAKKERFVDAHVADTRPVAAGLGIPVENILGLAAEESGWGTSGFAERGNNFFGIHYPAPNAVGYMTAQQDGRIAAFESYAASLQSFVAIAGPIVRGKEDPEEFARALQDSGKFGIDVTTGAKMPNYVPGLAATIRSLRAIIARRRP